MGGISKFRQASWLARTAMVAGCLLMVAACGVDDGAGIYAEPEAPTILGPEPLPAPAAISTADLDGRTFAAISLPGEIAGQDIPITLEFSRGPAFNLEGDDVESDLVSPYAGCNHASGAYTLTDDGYGNVRLHVESLMQTLMACAVHGDFSTPHPEIWWMGFIQADPIIELGGEHLTLTSGEEVVVMSDQPGLIVADQAPGTGATHLSGEFESTEADGLPDGLILNQPITVEFSGSRVSASAGCNRIMGLGVSEAIVSHYPVDPTVEAPVDDVIQGTISSPGTPATTRMYCEGLMEAEAWLIEFMSHGPEFTLQGDTLTLTDSTTTLTLTRSA